MRSAAVLSALIVASAIPVLAQTPEFGSHWHDGKAELNGYRWSGSRYGEDRTGHAVMIFVTEPFSRSGYVKVDDPSRDPADTFEALKLNMIRDFRTGIYDYNTMVSVFTQSADFSPVKISFSSAEWCGHVYEELLFAPGEVRHRYSSYFEGESAADALSMKPGGITEDDLFIRLRGLRSDFLGPGEQRSVPFLSGAFHRRLNHQPLEWIEAEIERLAATETVEVPAGTYESIVYLVRTSDGREGRFSIERAYPHRVLRWSWRAAGKEAESGVLTGSSRLAYWQLNHEGNESYLKELGL